MLRRRIRITAVIGSIAISSAQAGSIQVGPSSLEEGQVEVTSRAMELTEPEQRPLGAPSTVAAKNGVEVDKSGDTKPVAQLGLSKTLGALIVVVGLMLMLMMLIRWVSARKGGIMASLGPSGRAPSGIIEILARYPVARKQRLVLLRIGNRVILCCQTTGAKSASGAMTTLAELTGPEEVAAILRSVRDQDGTSNQAAFKDALKAAEQLPEEQGTKIDSVLKYTSPQGDTFQWQDERVKICDPQPETGSVDPSIGRLQARLAAMRSHGERA